MKPGDFAFGHIHDGKNIRKSLIDLVDLGNEDEAFKVCQIMNSKAPLTLRLNPVKVHK
jgi:hypothetical protein